jgi:hypothetical protein
VEIIVWAKILLRDTEKIEIKNIDMNTYMQKYIIKEETREVQNFTEITKYRE